MAALLAAGADVNAKDVSHSARATLGVMVLGCWEVERGVVLGGGSEDRG
jgi:hypothetical protein